MKHTWPVSAEVTVATERLVGELPEEEVPSRMVPGSKNAADSCVAPFIR